MSQLTSAAGTTGKRRLPAGTSRGVALLTVLTALSVLTIVATDLQYNARVDATLAENARDELIAYYNAKNALEIELGILRAVRQAQTTLKQFGIPLPNLVSMVPAECGLLGELVTLKDDTKMPMVGECMAKATPEKGKIDINRLGSIGDKQRIKNIIYMRLMDPRFDRFFEEENALGERITREELVNYITDYTDIDTVIEGSAAGDEDDSYARMKDRYKVKNAPYDSIAELQLIYGMNDALFAELEKSFTVYQVGGITLATADIPTILAVVRQAATNPYAITDQAMTGLVMQIDQIRQMPFGGAILNSQALVAAGTLFGVGLDAAKMKELVDDNASLDWYTVTASGQVNNVEKRIQATFNLGANQMVYFREE